MTPDEVRMLDNRYALLFIRGERPLIDEKYDLLKHPYVKYTTDGKGKPYQHGGTENAVASLTVPQGLCFVYQGQHGNGTYGFQP